jgi:DNA polymerase elongation subunit (family B)
METNSIFSYFWHTDDKNDSNTSIRLYGLSEDNKNMCLRISDFTPYIYIELPTHIDWNSGNKAQLLGDKIDQLIGDEQHFPIVKKVYYKYRLYYANLNKDGSRKKFPYLFCNFTSTSSIKLLSYRLKKPILVKDIGMITLKIQEQDADPILQLTCFKNLPTAGWINFTGKKMGDLEKLTLCDLEYEVSYKKLSRNETKTILAKPKIMGFDIEVNSTNISAMPKAENQGDKVFQISCVFAREGNPSDMKSYLLSLGKPDEKLVGENVIIYSFKTEAGLLEGFTKLIRKENPNIIAGYNILGFDIPYMIDRAKNDCTSFCISEFDKLGFHKYNHAKERTIRWSSSAFKNQEFQYLDGEGRLFVDILPLVKRDYKMDNYKLKTVAEFFLKDDSKDPLSVKGIFKCYREGTKKELDGSYSKKAIKAISLVGKYCVKDSELVIKLMDVLQTWTGLCEMASTCGTSIFSLYTQGQQIKVFSQVYKYCFQNNMVVEKDGYIAKDDERYVGAHVFAPVPGIYERVLPFDFCLTGDTLVTLANGTSKRIDQMTRDELVLGYNEKGFQNFSSINGLQRKGLRETIKVYLQDGRTISCTPEHKFMLHDGTWCEAKDLKDKEVMCGVEYPEDIKYENEKNWSLEVDGYTFTMNTDIEREKTLAFSRMLGYILSDGSIYESNILEGFCIYCNKLLNSKNALEIHNKTNSCRKKQEQFDGKTECEIKEYYENNCRIKTNMRPDRRFKQNGGSQNKRPTNIYQIFSKMEYENILLDKPGMKNTDIFKEIGVRWSSIKNNETELEKYKIYIPTKIIQSETETKTIKVRKNKKSCYHVFVVKEIEKIKIEFPGIKGKQINIELSNRWKLTKNNKTLMDALKKQIDDSDYLIKDKADVEKSKSAYWFYYKNEVDNIKTDNPSLNNKEIVKISYSLWNEIKKDKTNKYQIMSDNDKFEKNKKMPEYLKNETISPSINKTKRSEASFGTLIDAMNFKDDLIKICNIDVKIRKRDSDDPQRKKKGVTFCINIPIHLSKMLHSLEDIIIGKRTTQNMKLPKFLLSENCPLSVIKAFLGGLYGGDGSSPSLTPLSFSNVSFEWTTIENCINGMKETFENLKTLHKKLGINVSINEPHLVKYSGDCIKPKDYLENNRYKINLSVSVKDTEKFYNNIGFIYCVNKNCKLNISSSFRSFHSMNKKNNSKYYVKNTGIETWFDKKYIVESDDEYIPSYKQKIIKIEDNGIQEVYDIEVDKVHNFLANGIVSHNCSLYPTT